MVDFKEFIKRERLKRGWSQTLLGEKSGYSLNTIQYTENLYGTKNPRLYTLNDILGALGYELIIVKKKEDMHGRE